MNRLDRKLIKLIPALALICSLGWAQELTILSLSEYHGHLLPDGDGIGGLAQVGTIVDEVRAETGGNVLVVNTGDILIGTVMSSAFRGVPDIEAMNIIDFDALLLGNHEFDFGIAHMDLLENLANFPFLSTNLVGTYHLGVEAAVLKEVAGINVAIFGITNPNLYDVTSPETKNLVLADSMTVVRNAVHSVQNWAHVVILLTHQSTREDFKMLQLLDGVDLIIGGHSPGWNGMYLPRMAFDPSLPNGAPEVSTAASTAVLVKAPSFTEAISRVDLTIEGGKVIRRTAVNIPVQGFDPHPAVAALIEDYESNLSDRLNQVIGIAEVTLDGERDNVRSVETNLGNLIADSLRTGFPEADIGFANGGGIRNTISKGNITLGSLLEVHPWGNSIVTFDLTGTQLLAALENGVSQIEDSAGRFLQVSGMTFVFDQQLKPGNRVVSVEVAGLPLALGATYKIVTNNYIAGGGDGFEVFTEGQNFFDTQQLDTDVLGSYIQSIGNVSPAAEGRIINLGN
jgi:5'-nucleotidase/UDP-sugar diphosphatase